MKYSKEEALEEIRRRAGIIRQKHDRKVTNILTTTAGFTLIALFAVIGIFSGSAISATPSAYGAFIISAESGGYVLTAVLGITFGVTVTLLINHLKKKK